MQNIEINSEVQSLLDAVNKLFPGKVELQFIGKLQSGYVRHDQAQAVQDKDQIMVQISDLTAPNYTASHELLHILMTLKGFPQIYFAISTGETQLDQQLMMLGTELYDTVSHLVVVSEQRKHGLIDDEIEADYLKGIQATITPEPDPVDDKMTLRLLTLTDALVFYGDGNQQINAQLKKDYPTAFAAAKKLYALITEKPVDSPFTLRRNIVKLFKAFDSQLQDWGLPPINMTEFATISNVVSKRQLRLEVRQLFELYHSDMVDIKSKRRAYVGINRTDGQNSFVISAPTKNNDTPDYYKAVYALSVEELFKKLEMPYILR
ncbi:IpaB/EvcA family protein [Secundilactobacillus folii]|uniref:IpaB/EvcA family protein n=1 Tax=Secundilactobacillus folii TaxID=2678357 RepID=A0A7X2XXL6_9LACO|nr:IpaB/EvcA family protein [Secundilactobacillus folii]MTV82975.1 IpaB/EvcA family protein [Secundilactobacillus folii]